MGVFILNFCLSLISQVTINLMQKQCIMLYFIYDSDVSNNECDSDNKFDL